MANMKTELIASAGNSTHSIYTCAFFLFVVFCYTYIIWFSTFVNTKLKFEKLNRVWNQLSAHYFVYSSSLLFVCQTSFFVSRSLAFKDFAFYQPLLKRKQSKDSNNLAHTIYMRRLIVSCLLLHKPGFLHCQH